MNDLLARSPVNFHESSDGKLVFGNTKALEPNGFIELVIGTDTFRIKVDEKGFYRWEASTPYADGSYSFSIRHFDDAGNRNAPTLGTIIVDTTSPEAPELLNLYDDKGAITGSFDPSKATDDKRPTLTGIAQKGTIVYLLNDKDEKIGSAVADKVTGKWVMEPAKDLKEGTNSLRLVAEETFAKQPRTGVPSEPFDIVIVNDTLPPGTVTITDAFDNAGSFTGSLGNGALTDDATPTLRGEASFDSTVTVYYRLAGSPIWAGSVTATVSGNTWSWTPNTALATGTYEFQASNGATSTALFTLQIATAEQIAQLTRIESVYDDFGQVQGPLASGAITDDATPSLRGRAEANSSVVIRYMLENGTAASVVVDADSAGNWFWTPAAELQTGLWTFDVQTQGHSGWSSPFKLQITGSGENSYDPVIDYAVDDAGSAQGERQSGTTIDDTTPTLHGKAEANSIVYLQAIYDGETQLFSFKVDASSHWEWTPPAELAQGNWKFQVSKSVGEGFGNVFELNISQVPPYGPNGNEDFSTCGKNLVILKGESFKTPGGLIIESLAINHVINHPDYDRFGTTLSSLHQNLSYVGKPVLKITFPKTQSVSFMAKDIQSSSNKFKFYDENNVLIGEKGADFGGGNSINVEISFIAPPGVAISYMIFEPGLAHGFDVTDGVFFDDFNWRSEADNVSEIQNNDEELTLHHFDGTEFVTTADVNHDISIIGHENQIDSLQFTSSEQLFDLTALHNKIESVEIFDITGAGNNTLKLDLTTLLQNGEKDLFIEDGKTQLMINGDAGDVVQLKDILPQGSDISEWQHQQGTVTVAGVEYEVYSHGDDAELLVQQGVKTELI